MPGSVPWDPMRRPRSFPASDCGRWSAEYADLLARFGEAFTISSGGAAVPGSEDAWEKLAGANPRDAQPSSGHCFSGTKDRWPPSISRCGRLTAPVGDFSPRLPRAPNTSMPGIGTRANLAGARCCSVIGGGPRCWNMSRSTRLVGFGTREAGGPGRKHKGPTKTLC